MRIEGSVRNGDSPRDGAGRASHGASKLRGVALAALAALFLMGCGAQDETASQVETDGDSGIEKTFDRGPVSVRLHVDKKEATIADRLNLTIEVFSAEDYEARLPAFGEKLDQFGIVDYTTPQPELVEGNKTKRARAYTLEPFLSGDYVIPPMKVEFWKKDEENAKRHELETEEIEITIKSPLAEDVADLQIHDIEEPVEMPRPKAADRPLFWIGLGCLAVALIAGALYFALRGKERAAGVVSLPAHEIAYRELERLIAEDLPGKGEIKEFYQRISDILRRYIENRFGLHAPEQTTEEFLAALGSDATLAPGHKSLLKNFLLHCDLVKFAAHEPSTEDIQKTFDSCKNFIGETKVDEAATQGETMEGGGA